MSSQTFFAKSRATLRAHLSWCKVSSCVLSSMEPSQAPKVEDTDNSLEFGQSGEDLSWNHRTSTPPRSETNGTAERAVRRVKEGTSAVLRKSGLDEQWWSDSMECYFYLRNVQDLLADGKTRYERRFWRTILRANNTSRSNG